jgi:hypothetical protein
VPQAVDPGGALAVVAHLDLQPVVPVRTVTSARARA